MTVGLYSQDELIQRGSIPAELLRPRREEALRYPVDVVIGPLGRGTASEEAYGVAIKAAAALLAGTPDAAVFSSVNKSFLENCFSSLNIINPRTYRLGSGRIEPDGSVSFLVRFSGREQGITGELFVRRELQKPKAPEPVAAAVIEQSDEDTEVTDNTDIDEENETPEYQEEKPRVEIPAEIPLIPGGFVWVFEDLILEEPRSRQEENAEDRKRFDFSPYERLY